MVNSNYQLNERVFYRDNRLRGFNLNGDWISPEKMLMVYRQYEQLLKQGRRDAAEIIQKERWLPRTWLHLVNSYFSRDTKYLKNKMNRS